jgi:GNAT superfamily N-acetyltransferase
MKPDHATFQICLAEASDATAIASLLYNSFVEYQPLYTPAAFSATTPGPTQIQGRLAEGPVWVTCHQDRLVGTISAVPQDTGLHLRSMAVLPSARGYGVGRALLQHVEQFALTHSYRYLVLSTTPFLTQAIRLYEQFGFQPIPDGPHEFYGTALLSMLKSLVSSMQQGNSPSQPAG